MNYYARRVNHDQNSLMSSWLVLIWGGVLIGMLTRISHHTAVLQQPTTWRAGRHVYRGQ